MVTAGEDVCASAVNPSHPARVGRQLRGDAHGQTSGSPLVVPAKGGQGVTGCGRPEARVVGRGIGRVGACVVVR